MRQVSRRHDVCSKEPVIVIIVQTLNSNQVMLHCTCQLLTIRQVVCFCSGSVIEFFVIVTGAVLQHYYMHAITGGFFLDAKDCCFFSHLSTQLVGRLWKISLLLLVSVASVGASTHKNNWAVLVGGASPSHTFVYYSTVYLPQIL